MEEVKLLSMAEESAAAAAIIGEEYCGKEERELTVRKSSLFCPRDGYDVYDHQNGELVFRVDCYGQSTFVSDLLVLMDSAGAPILTVKRKRPSLHQRWEGFVGERKDGQEPLFSVKRSSIFGKDCSLDVELHDKDNNHIGYRQYRIEGCFAERSCKLSMRCSINPEDEHEETMVAEIKSKVNDFSDAVLGNDVFCLCVKPHFDMAFAMGLVLILDQISGHDEDDHTNYQSTDAAIVAPTNEDDTNVTIE